MEAKLLVSSKAKQINGKTQASPDLVLLDVLLPGIDGLGILERIREDYPSLPVVMITASDAVKTAVSAMKIGAVDYLNKPFEMDELYSMLEESLVKDPGGSAVEPVRAISSVADKEIEADFGCIVGRHALMEELYSKIEQVAKRDTTILITGESGTGKELVAAEIHKAQRSRPWTVYRAKLRCNTGSADRVRTLWA